MKISKPIEVSLTTKEVYSILLKHLIAIKALPENAKYLGSPIFEKTDSLSLFGSFEFSGIKIGIKDEVITGQDKEEK